MGIPEGQIRRVGEIFLANVAGAGVTAAGDDKQVVYTAVGRPIRLFDEADFPDRTVQRDKRWNCVPRSELGGDR